ncbi:hypothetical protein AVEN_87634-1 [Araneus ventricosus]|uniref:Uncharacterized protein n=1 Tax=Araneus ventricosus TaxID=182803 RepID=A0A4Y2JT66_ARAVE|nr:hypothetical protein AVEN_87634-1 [Araneus ventricosus]
MVSFNAELRSSHWGLRKELDSHAKTPQNLVWKILYFSMSKVCKVKVFWFSLTRRLDIRHDDAKFLRPQPPPDPISGLPTASESFVIHLAYS